jgi:D-lactate dehydrogenase
MTVNQSTTSDIINQLKSLLGGDHVAIGKEKTEHYRKGWRSGSGSALAVVFPQSLLHFWQVLEICIANDSIIVIQAANTGLTEGSTPSGEDYDRQVIVINTLAMNKLILLDQGQQIIGLPGSTLHDLEKALKPLNRSPHSVIGSSCLGASIVGGVANNSGGALVKRGPAYTELSLFAWVNEAGELNLVNHLGLELGETPEEMITNLESEYFKVDPSFNHKKESASDYQTLLREIDADSPSRFNADPSRLFESSGCAGKIAVFAVRLDTFEVAEREQTFYIGTNDPQVLTKLRRDMLSQFDNLPEVAEYLHRDTFEIAKQCGKDTFLSVQYLGTDLLPKMFAVKARIDAALNKISFMPDFLSDRVMQGVANFFPQHLPHRMLKFHDKYAHHLILKMSEEGIAEARQYLQNLLVQDNTQVEYFECSNDEASKAYLHRFAAAGAAIRYQTLNHKTVGEILALDIALRRNDTDWVESLPQHISDKIEKRLYYGHFFCHVFHQDYILKKGVDAAELKQQMLELLDRRGAKYPAEHNVGHLYAAGQSQQDFYRKLDPTNSFNPGIGKMEKHKRNCACCI